MVLNGKNKDSFKAVAKKSMLIKQHVDSCSNLYISSLSAHLGKPSQLWSCSLNDRSLHGPQDQASYRLWRPRTWRLKIQIYRSTNAAPGDATCKLCNLGLESPSHFLSTCPALSSLREALIAASIKYHSSGDVLLGLVWSSDAHACVRLDLTLSPQSAQWHSNFKVEPVSSHVICRRRYKSDMICYIPPRSNMCIYPPLRCGILNWFYN